jgi:hypothetical protein
MRAILRISSLGILLTAVGAIAQSSASVPDLDTIVGRMQAANATRNRDLAYSVTREYKLAPEDASKTSLVIAKVNVVQSGRKDYSITRGSGQAENVVRKVLDHETAAANDQSTSGEIIPQNYEFEYLESEPLDGHLCYVLKLKPRRNAKDVLNGKVWIDADSYLIRQVTGSLVKNPSWWVKDVQLTLHYADIDGVWLQDSGQAIAQVRLVGKHTLTSRAINVHTDTALASNSAQRRLAIANAQKRNRRVDPSLLGAGVFQHR